MPIITLEHVTNYAAKQRRMIGLDVGTKTIGVAISDTSWFMSNPLKLIERTKLAKDIEALFKLSHDNNAEIWVVGLPLNMDGTEGPRCQAVRQLVRDIHKQEDIPVLFMDERMSTQAVEKQMIEADLSRKKRDKRVDNLAAAFILQGVLDAWQFRKRENNDIF